MKGFKSYKKTKLFFIFVLWALWLSPSQDELNAKEAAEKGITVEQLIADKKAVKEQEKRNLELIRDKREKEREAEKQRELEEEEARKAQKKSIIKKCRVDGDVRACIDGNVMDTVLYQGACTDALEDHMDTNSIYGWKWDDSLLDTKWSTYVVKDPIEGTVVWYGSQVSVKNASGTYKNKNLYEYLCMFDVDEPEKIMFVNLYKK